MKRIVSVSLGSSKRNHQVVTKFADEKFLLERIGTDGSIEKAIDLVKSLRNQVDAIGLGGMDLYIYAGKKRYTFREAKKIAKAAGTTPIVDGSGLKNTLEKKVILELQEQKIIEFKDKKVLLVCGVDRMGMAEAFEICQSKVLFGDLLFGLGLPIGIYHRKIFQVLAQMIAPVITKLPIRWTYPIGVEQETTNSRFATYFQQAEIIAGDFHFIKKNMPENLSGKTIITNTVTRADVAMLRKSGVALLVTTTPNLNGRSFGTNVIEAMLVSCTKKKPSEMSEAEYESLIEAYCIKPHIQYLA